MKCRTSTSAVDDLNYSRDKSAILVVAIPDVPYALG